MRRWAGLRASLSPFALLLAILLRGVTPADATMLVIDDERSIFHDGMHSCGITSCSVYWTEGATHDGVSPQFGIGLAAYASYVYQNSLTSPDGIFGIGITESAPAIDVVEVDAESVLSITFQLTEATPYRLVGFVDADVDLLNARDPFGSATVRLNDANGTLHEFSVSTTALPQNEAFSEEGFLPAGAYTLFAQALQGPSADGITTRFQVQLALPEPGPALLLGGFLLLAARLRR